MQGLFTLGVHDCQLALLAFVPNSLCSYSRIFFFSSLYEALSNVLSDCTSSSGKEAISQTT
jgi:hypothetical protein